MEAEPWAFKGGLCGEMQVGTHDLSGCQDTFYREAPCFFCHLSF